MKSILKLFRIFNGDGHCALVKTGAKIFLKKGLLAYKEEKPFLDFEMLKNNKKLVTLIILMITTISALAGIYFLKTTTYDFIVASV